jgi:hypothetical protein
LRRICSRSNEPNSNLRHRLAYTMATLTKTATQPQAQALDHVLASSIPSPFPRELLQESSDPEPHVEAVEAPEVEAGPSRTLPASEANATMVLVSYLALNHLFLLTRRLAGTNAVNRICRKDMSHDAEQPALELYPVESYCSGSKALDAFDPDYFCGSADRIPVLVCTPDTCL